MTENSITNRLLLISLLFMLVIPLMFLAEIHVTYTQNNGKFNIFYSYYDKERNCLAFSGYFGTQPHPLFGIVDLDRQQMYYFVLNSEGYAYTLRKAGNDILLVTGYIEGQKHLHMPFVGLINLSNVPYSRILLFDVSNYDVYAVDSHLENGSLYILSYVYFPYPRNDIDTLLIVYSLKTRKAFFLTYGSLMYDDTPKKMLWIKGSLYVFGNTYSPNASMSDIFILKIGKNGEKIESYIIGSAGRDNFEDVLYLNNTFYIVGDLDRAAKGTDSLLLVTDLKHSKGYLLENEGNDYTKFITYDRESRSIEVLGYISIRNSIYPYVHLPDKGKLYVIKGENVELKITYWSSDAAVFSSNSDFILLKDPPLKARKGIMMSSGSKAGLSYLSLLSYDVATKNYKIMQGVHLKKDVFYSFNITYDCNVSEERILFNESNVALSNIGINRGKLGENPLYGIYIYLNKILYPWILLLPIILLLFYVVFVRIIRGARKRISP